MLSSVHGMTAQPIMSAVGSEGSQKCQGLGSVVQARPSSQLRETQPLASVPGSREAVLNATPTDPCDGGNADRDGLGTSVINPGRPVGALVSLEQDTGMGQPARCALTYRNQVVERLSLLSGQGDAVLLAHTSTVLRPQLTINSPVMEH